MQSILKSAVRLSRVSFHASVDNADRVPEHNYSEDSAAPNRKADIYMTPTHIYLNQKNKWFGTSSASIKDFTIKQEWLNEQVMPKPTTIIKKAATKSAKEIAAN